MSWARKLVMKQATKPDPPTINGGYTLHVDSPVVAVIDKGVAAKLPNCCAQDSFSDQQKPSREGKLGHSSLGTACIYAPCSRTISMVHAVPRYAKKSLEMLDTARHWNLH